MIYGQDNALALTYAGFSIGMDGHDRAAALTAFEAAPALSASSALTYILGSVVLGWGGEAERAIEWGERGGQEPASAAGNYSRSKVSGSPRRDLLALLYGAVSGDQGVVVRAWHHLRNHVGRQSV
ncbi:MAG TPA: hypothetical protein VG900_14570 [Hyphomicrobiaceae bacterium]|nr:hypothetical protein [Hyphomicrobiaceae bacterium]